MTTFISQDYYTRTQTEQTCTSVITNVVTHCDTLLREPVSVVWSRVVDIRTLRNNPERIDARVAAVVMPLDVLHVHRAANSGDLEDILGVVEEIGVFT